MLQMDQRLETAAQEGNTEQLYELLQEDAYALEGFNSVPFAETPLHVAAAWGNIEFAMQIMNLKPSFAQKLNRSLYSPLHIAMQRDQMQLVHWLLKCDKGLVRLKGRDGKTPLHLAVEMGNVDLIIEFLNISPECMKDVTNRGENALHIAVNGNNWEVVEVLVGWLRRNCHKNAMNMEDEVMNGKDLRGNTVLHTAAYKNSRQVLRLLLTCRNIKKDIMNLQGLTAQDVLKLRTETGQATDIETKKIIKQLEAPKSCSKTDSGPTNYKFFAPNVSFRERKLISAVRTQVNITEGMSNAMLVVAALILTIGFQGMLSPPGGVYQSNSSGNTNKTGKTVMNDVTFVFYWCFNTLAVALVFLVTIYLLPPSSMSLLFNVAMFWLLTSYIACVQVVSPFAFLSEVTRALLLISYVSLIYYWHFLKKMRKCCLL